MSDTPLPTPIWSGTLRLFNVDLKCHVLDDGRRIVEQESMEALFEAMACFDGLDVVDSLDAGALSEFCRGTGIPE